MAELWAVPAPEKRSKSYHAALRKAQSLAVEGCFYDRLKQSGSIQWAREHLDEALKTDKFAEELNWLLVNA